MSRKFIAAETLSSVTIVDGRGNIDAANKKAISLAQMNTKIVQKLTNNDKKQSIGIEEVGSLRRFNQLKSAGQTAAFVILNADLLTIEAQNSLLKTLEELNEGKLVLLAAANPENLLPTVRSRAKIIQARDLKIDANNKKEKLIKDAALDSSFSYEGSEEMLSSVGEFLRLGMAERLVKYKYLADDKQKMVEFIQAVKVAAVAAMRNSAKSEGKLAWAKKVDTLDKILAEAKTNASPKILLLSLSTRV